MDATFGILYVDDETRSLRAFERLFKSEFPVFTATNVIDGLAVLKANRHEIGILMADQRMPGGTGVALLEQAHEVAPEIIRILVTAYADTASAIAAVNRGKISYFIEKPWKVDKLSEILHDSLQMFEAKMVQQQLLGTQLDGLRESYQSDQIGGFRFLAAGMSHNLSNALGPIRCFLDALPSKLDDLNLDIHRTDDPAYWVTLQADAQENTQTISQLGRALQEAANVEPFRCDDSVCLRELVAEAIADVGEQLAASLIKCRNAVPASLPLVAGNEDQLRRLFRLFLESALAELPSGSKLQWTAQEYHSRSGPESILLQITDDGNDLCDRHFGLPFRPIAGEDGSSHLALNQLTSYMIAHYHDAKISLAENLDGGVTVSIRLPRKPRPVEAISDRLFFDLFVPD